MPSRLDNNIRNPAWRRKYSAFVNKVQLRRQRGVSLPLRQAQAKTRPGYRASMSLGFRKFLTAVRTQKNLRKALVKKKFGRDIGGVISSFLR